MGCGAAWRSWLGMRVKIVDEYNRIKGVESVYAVGDDAEAAALAGIRVNRILLSVYMVAGLICGLAAWSAIGRVGSVIRYAADIPAVAV